MCARKHAHIHPHVLVHMTCAAMCMHMCACEHMCEHAPSHTCTVTSRAVVTPRLMSWLLEAHTQGISLLSTLEATQMTGWGVPKPRGPSPLSHGALCIRDSAFL